MKIYSLITSLILSAYCSCIAHESPLKSEPHSDKTITRIAFGSCNNPRRESEGMFEAIASQKPDVFVFIGDTIYGDTLDMEILKEKYGELEKQKGYQKLRENTQILATWDDHDFGLNDSGTSHPKKKESQKVFLDFYQEPKDSARRATPGIYGTHTFGKKGKICQIILLDTRYFRDELKRVNLKNKPKPKNRMGIYAPTDDTSKKLLGEAQWKWLEEQLQQPADVRIIASSIQILAKEKGMESWGNVPHEEQRLYDLLKKHNVTGTIAISGDVHYSELSKKDIGGYPFYDFTSSGMTHTKLKWSQYTNTLRVGEAVANLNAGVIDIDWEKMIISLKVIDQSGKVVKTDNLKLSDLKFK